MTSGELFNVMNLIGKVDDVDCHDAQRLG